MDRKRDEVETLELVISTIAMADGVVCKNLHPTNGRNRIGWLKIQRSLESQSFPQKIRHQLLAHDVALDAVELDVRD
jgi:hypothetical protein